MTLLDATSSTDLATERAERLTTAGQAWSERIAADAANALLTYRVRGTGEGSVATRITAGKHEWVVDEPAALAGDDAAPSPVEYALGALSSCQVVVYRLYAQALGIRLDEVKVDVEGDLDARGLFGIDASVRPGFRDIRITITLEGPEPRERYEELRAAVDAACPVLDLFANATPVSARIA
ncbi:OsmC family protein [Naasia sp. SYSU D00948]|uniref:OsmC family protein n=1 Tax=Naasia sp. SYSU D00948 TaxID=2817379 RepID=UPI001B312BDE|nr:OsmC family protein [Naasia sp. SYSU D00948]